jgi:3-oxoacyl-(acyl-carrier-protein) synthase
MALFINGVGSISPAQDFDEIASSTPLAGNRLRCIEPDYAAFLDPKVSRRMSRIVKMGIVTAMQAMRSAQLEAVDGVIAGTGWGCLEDTVAFLQKMVANKEEMLSPTAFIHSTHNTIAAQIAYHLKCRGYNSTYVHRNISFESTLIDAMLLLQERPNTNLLVGGIDELTDTSFTILSRLNTFKTPQQEPAELYASGTSGTWAGEGSTFFVVSNQPGPNSLAQLLEVRTVSFSSPEQAATIARNMLSTHGHDQVDLLISGDNGDTENDAAGQVFEAAFAHQGPVQRFKHLCGEYPTASAFAVGLASSLLSSPAEPAPKTILIYNRFQQAHQSLLLLTAC